MLIDEFFDEFVYLLCLIMCVMFCDLVFVLCSGNMYECEVLEKFWFSASGRARDLLMNVEMCVNLWVVYMNWDK